MNGKSHLFNEIVKFLKESEKEHPDLKNQFDLYLKDKKKYEATKETIGKDFKSETYGVKYSK